MTKLTDHVVFLELAIKLKEVSWIDVENKQMMFNKMDKRMYFFVNITSLFRYKE